MFYANPDLRDVAPPQETTPGLDLAGLIDQLQKSPELANALARIITLPNATAKWCLLAGFQNLLANCSKRFVSRLAVFSARELWARTRWQMGERNVKKKKPPNIQGNSVVLASPARLERAAFRLGGERSILLSYGDMYWFSKVSARLVSGHLTLRRLNMRFSNKVRNCRYYPVFAYFTGISIMSIMSANVPFNALFPPKC